MDLNIFIFLSVFGFLLSVFGFISNRSIAKIGMGFLSGGIMILIGISIFSDPITTTIYTDSMINQPLDIGISTSNLAIIYILFAILNFFHGASEAF